MISSEEVEAIPRNRACLLSASTPCTVKFFGPTDTESAQSHPPEGDDADDDA